MSVEETSLIIGGGSLFGRYLAPLLLHEGGRVVVTKRIGQNIITDPNVEKYAGNCDRLEWTEIDVLDKESILSVLQTYRPSFIYNFASQNSVGYAWKQPKETVDINIIGVLNLFDTVRSVEDYHPRILLSGSGEEYGRKDYNQFPLSEELQPSPNNLFAATKVEQSLLANIYYRAFGMDTITVRTFGEFGPGMSARFSISDFCKQFARESDKFILHVGNINIERDWTDIRDLVRAFVLLSKKGQFGEVYNAGVGRSTALKDVITILEDISGIHPDIVVDPSRIRTIDTPRFQSDNSKIEADTGWKAEIDLRKTITDIYEYWKEKITDNWLDFPGNHETH